MATEIKYNGSVIASPEAGQTATLKCKGMKMESDVVVEVAEQGGDGTDTTATATVNDIRDGETAWVNGVKITGEVPVRDSNNVVVDLSNTVTNTNTVTVNVAAGITVDTDSDPNNVLITATASSTASASATAEATATADTSVANGIYDTEVTKAPTKSATKTATDSNSDSDTATAAISKITADNVSFGTDGTVYIDAAYFDRYPNGQEKLPIAPPVQYSDANTEREGYEGGIKVYPGLASEGWKKDSTDYVNISDNSFTSENIKYNTTIFDITGTFTEDANATANDILSGKHAYVKGEKVDGNIQSVDYPAFQNALNSMTTPEIPFTWDRYYYANSSPAVPKVPECGELQYSRIYSSPSGGNLYVYAKPASAGWIKAVETPKITVHDDNFSADNIKSGVTMFGVTGTYTGETNPFSNTLYATYSTPAEGSAYCGIIGGYLEDPYIAEFEVTLPSEGFFRVNGLRAGQTRLVVQHYTDTSYTSTTLSYYTVVVSAL